MAVVGGLWFGAFWRRRRRKPTVEGWPGDLETDRAGELRAKLAESKRADESGVGQEPATADVSPVEPASPLDPEVRRRSIHEHARSSIDELK